MGDYGIPICANSTLHSLSQIDKLIDCPKPCTLYKMQPRATSFQASYIWYTRVEIIFQEATTISYDQYSYTWLHLVAEFGGYIGLFLGCSVFQFADLIDILLQRSWVESFKSLLNRFKTSQ